MKPAYKHMKKVDDIEMPWHVMRFFVEGNRKIYFCGDQASFGEDYGTVEELRKAIKWFVEEFGGKVKWEE